MKILVTPAFFNEIESFMSVLKDVQELIIAKRKCWRGMLNGHVIYVSLTGMGVGHAAANVTALCERLEPDCILICCTSGGLVSGQEVGDIIIGASVIDIDFYSLPVILGNTPYESCLTDPHLDKPFIFEHKPKDSFLTICLNTNLLRVTAGNIVTSNTFPVPLALFQTIQSLQGHVIEMEATGILNAVSHYDIPAILIKAISNHINEVRNDQGTTAQAIQTCSARLSEYISDLLPRLHVLAL